MTEKNTETAAPASKTARARTSRSAAAKPVDMFPNFDAFAMPKLEVPAIAREAAEKSIEQAREAYAKMKSAAEDATDLLEDTFETTRQGFLDFNLKAVDSAKANTDATFRFVKDLMGVRTVAEAIELQSSFARSQFDALTTQAREMQELATKIATEVGQPVKEAFEKSVKDLKAA